MSVTKIRGNIQIMDDSITDAQIKSDAAIALSKLAEAVIQADGGQEFTGDQSMGGNRVTELGSPSDGTDAANRDYVDTSIAAMATGSGKTAVRVATTGNITLSGTQTIDGVALSADDRIFVKNQTAPEENGIYDVKAGAWTRSTDGNTWNELVSALIPVSEGTVNADTLWLVTADRGGTLGTTAVTSTQLPGPSDIVAGDALTRSGQTLNVAIDNSTVEISGDALRVKDAGITAAKLAAAVAGNGLSGGAGTALAVNVDGSTVEINADAVRVKDAGITSAKLGTGARRITRETPTGAINGANTTFTLANTPAAGTEEVFINGILQEPGAGNDYTISTNEITTLTVLSSPDKIRVNYLY
jgi:hypothetical protein